MFEKVTARPTMPEVDKFVSRLNFQVANACGGNLTLRHKLWMLLLLIGLLINFKLFPYSVFWAVKV